MAPRGPESPPERHPDAERGGASDVRGDESFDYDVEGPPSQGRWQIHGLGLPAEVLAQVYAGNARRLIRFG